MKKLIIAAVIGMIVFAGCGDDAKKDDTTKTVAAKVTPEPTPEATPDPGVAIAQRMLGRYQRIMTLANKGQAAANSGSVNKLCFIVHKMNYTLEAQTTDLKLLNEQSPDFDTTEVEANMSTMQSLMDTINSNAAVLC
jgi:hypothetical protein